MPIIPFLWCSTSGARISIIQRGSDGEENDDIREIYTQAVSWGDPSQKDASLASYDDPKAWMNAIESLLNGASEALGESGDSPSSNHPESSATTPAYPILTFPPTLPQWTADATRPTIPSTEAAGVANSDDQVGMMTTMMDRATVSAV